MEYSVGAAIKKINSSNINKLYLLKGDDYFLQNFFIRNVNEKFDNSIKPSYLNLEEDEDLFKLLNISSSNLLFSDKNIFIIKNFNRISLKNKNELITSFKLDNNDTVFIFISNDYYSKNKFISQIASQSIIVDSRTPFPNKIKQWVNFRLKKKGIIIDQFFLENLIQSYSDDISNVLQEIEKIYLLTTKKNIGYNNVLITDYINRNIRPWQVLNSIGVKNLKESISLIEALFYNGLTITPFIINFVNFYKELYIHKLDSSYNANNYNGLNKIVNNNMPKYLKNYKMNEIENIIIELKNIDVVYKTTSISHTELILVFVTKVCKNYYE